MERGRVDVKNIWEYLSCLIFSRPDKFIWIFCKKPKNWMPFLAIAGYSIIYAILTARVIVIFEWALISLGYNNSYYWNIKYMIPFQRFDVLAGITVSLFQIFFWLLREYHKSKKLTKSEPCD